jgi:hypothetical protein
MANPAQIVINVQDRVQWETLTASVVALIIATFGFFQNRIYAYYFKRSNLVFDKKFHKITHAHGQTTYFRLSVTNNGKGSAKGVEAVISNITKDGKTVEILPSPLEWTHHTPRTTRDIQANQPAQLDFVRFWKKLDKLSVTEIEKYRKYNPKAVIQNSSLITPVLSFLSPPIMDQLDLSSLIKGKSIVILKLYQKSGQVVKIGIDIDWDGENEPKLSNIKQYQTNCL